MMQDLQADEKIVPGTVLLVLIFTVVVGHFVMTLMASLRAQRGLAYRYPINMRIIKTPARDR